MSRNEEEDVMKTADWALLAWTVCACLLLFHEQVSDALRAIAGLLA